MFAAVDDDCFLFDLSSSGGKLAAGAFSFWCGLVIVAVSDTFSSCSMSCFSNLNSLHVRFLNEKIERKSAKFDDK